MKVVISGLLQGLVKISKSICRSKSLFALNLQP